MVVKRQHYVPRFYLRGFADESGKLFALRREQFTGREECFSTNANDICIEKYLYEVKCDDSRFVEIGAVEDWLSKFEHFLAPRIRKLCEWDFRANDSFPEDGGELIASVEFFLSNIVVRNPNWLKPQRAASKVLTKKLVEDGFFSKRDLLELDALGYASNLESIVELGIQHAELCMNVEGSSMERLISVLESMDIVLLKAPTMTDFVTSSYPLEMSWEDTDDDDPSEVYFPLCRDTAILFTRGGGNRQLRCVYIKEDEVLARNITLLMRNPLWNCALANSRGTLEDLRRACCE